MKNTWTYDRDLRVPISNGRGGYYTYDNSGFQRRIMCGEPDGGPDHDPCKWYILYRGVPNTNSWIEMGTFMTLEDAKMGIQ